MMTNATLGAMRRAMICTPLAVLLLTGATPLQCATPERTRIDLRCTSSGAGPTLDCALTLRTGARPLTGARMTVSAHMPSMPMAHRVVPVIAKPGSAPGSYGARLELEMPGVWALEFDLTAPRRDKLVRRVRAEVCAQASCPAQVLR